MAGRKKKKKHRVGAKKKMAPGGFFQKSPKMALTPLALIISRANGDQVQVPNGSFFLSSLEKGINSQRGKVPL